MVCSGYVFMDLPDPPTNEAAEQGTAAGEYLERLLTGQPIPHAASNGVYFDEEIKFYTTPIYEDIMSRTSEQVLCETRIDWQTRSGIWIRGQYDACFVDEQGRLCIEDLKYGWNLVEVEENWQLLGYAIGEILRRGRRFDEISLKIHQPRPHHEDGSSREWLITYDQLLTYKEKIEERMLQIAQGNRTLTTSKNCKYCEAAGEACPAFNRVFHRALEVSTEFHQDSITDEELSRQLDIIKRAEDALKIKKDSLYDLGVERIKQGKIIPNYVIEKKYGYSEWKKGVSPEAIKVMTGIDITEKKVMSPNKAKKLGVNKELVKQLTKREFKGTQLKKADTTKIGNQIFGNINPTGGKS